MAVWVPNDDLNEPGNVNKYIVCEGFYKFTELHLVIALSSIEKSPRFEGYHHWPSYQFVDSIFSAQDSLVEVTAYVCFSVIWVLF